MQSTEESVTEVSASDLKILDPKRFEREYSKWTEYNLDYDWWDSIEEMFKTDTSTEGVEVDRIYFSVSYSQGDYAAFEGTVNVATWMEKNSAGGQSYADKYPALYLAVCDYGGRSTVTTRSREGHPSVNWVAACVGNTPPAGIFAMLEHDAWDELVEAQYSEADLESAIQAWVNDKCDELYEQLQEEIEHLNSEESFIESCECNDVTFEIEDDTCDIS